MAYIRKEKSAEIRKALKAEFPGWKFSVRIRHHSALSVTILEAPIALLNCQIKSEHTTETDLTKYTGVNHYWMSDHWSEPALSALKRIVQICNEGNHDNSDPMTDYFDVGWYFDLSIGSWEKPFIYTEAQMVA